MLVLVLVVSVYVWGAAPGSWGIGGYPRPGSLVARAARGRMIASRNRKPIRKRFANLPFRACSTISSGWSPGCHGATANLRTIYSPA